MGKTKIGWKGHFLGLVTPFDADGCLNLIKYQESVELAITNRVHGILAAGCTGEWWTLSDAERVAVFKAAVTQARGRATVIGGTSSIRTSHAIELTKAAKEA